MPGNTKGSEPTFRYDLKKQIRELMIKHNLSYTDVFLQLGFQSRQCCRAWLISTKRCAGLEATQGLKDLKVIYE